MNDEYIYGRRPVAELLRHAPERVKQILVAGELGSEFAAGDIPVKRVSRDDLDKRFDGAVHQGIAARLHPFEYADEDEILRDAAESGRPVVVLDQVSDPHNLGAILRAADGAGAAGVILPERRSAHLTPTVRKASAGASEVVPLAIASNLRRFLEKAKKADFWVYGAALGPESKPYTEVAFDQKTVLVLGAEGEGIRRLTEESCDFLVQIPMYGKLESLNVSQAAAILLYAIRAGQK